MPSDTAPQGQPQFGQPVYTPDPSTFIVPHPSDSAAYKVIDELNREGKIQPMAFPPSRGGAEPVLSLADVLGSSGAQVTADIEKNAQIVFHAVGDTGNVRGPDTQSLVSDKMVADFDEPLARDVPQFFFHLGDVIYNFGEAQFYYDQFYDPYRNYPAPILAIAGNHDGMVAPDTDAATLEAFLRNFCAETFATSPEAGGLNRTTQIQPGVYFTFEAPFLRILSLYTNTLEDPGVISSQGGKYPQVTDVQLDYLRAALTRAKSENYAGALIIAHHHPSYTAGNKHGWSQEVTAEIDQLCEEVGLWPHAVLSAHAHNYQRYTRTRDGRETPYLVAGNGGHNVTRLTRKADGPLRTPMTILDQNNETVVLENYDDADYGYLRIIVNAQQLRLEYHPALDGSDQKTPDDSITIDLASRTIAHYVPAPAPADPTPATVDARGQPAHTSPTDGTTAQHKSTRRTHHGTSSHKHSVASRRSIS